MPTVDIEIAFCLHGSSAQFLKSYKFCGVMHGTFNFEITTTTHNTVVSANRLLKIYG